MTHSHIRTKSSDSQQHFTDNEFPEERIKLSQYLLILPISGSEAQQTRSVDFSHKSIEEIDTVPTSRALMYIEFKGDSNYLTSLRNISQFQNLKKISLRDNEIENLENIYYLRGLTSIEELDLRGNSITGQPEYMDLVLLLLPKLKILDGKAVKSDRKKEVPLLMKQNLALIDQFITNEGEIIKLESVVRKLKLHQSLYHKYDIYCHSHIPFDLPKFLRDLSANTDDAFKMYIRQSLLRHLNIGQSLLNPKIRSYGHKVLADQTLKANDLFKEAEMLNINILEFVRNTLDTSEMRYSEPKEESQTTYYSMLSEDDAFKSAQSILPGLNMSVTSRIWNYPIPEETEPSSRDTSYFMPAETAMHSFRIEVADVLEGYEHRRNKSDNIQSFEEGEGSPTILQETQENKLDKSSESISSKPAETKKSSFYEREQEKKNELKKQFKMAQQNRNDKENTLGDKIYVQPEDWTEKEYSGGKFLVSASSEEAETVGLVQHDQDKIFTEEEEVVEEAPNFNVLRYLRAKYLNFLCPHRNPAKNQLASLSRRKDKKMLRSSFDKLLANFFQHHTRASIANLEINNLEEDEHDKIEKKLQAVHINRQTARKLVRNRRKGSPRRKFIQLLENTLRETQHNLKELGEELETLKEKYMGKEAELFRKELEWNHKEQEHLAELNRHIQRLEGGSAEYSLHQGKEEEYNRKDQEYASKDMEYAQKEKHFADKIEQYERKGREYAGKEEQYLQKIAESAELREKMEKQYQSKEAEYTKKEEENANKEKAFAEKEQLYANKQKEYERELQQKTREAQQMQEEYRRKDEGYQQKDQEYRSKDEGYIKKDKENDEKEKRYAALAEQYRQKLAKDTKEKEELQKAYKLKDEEYVLKDKEYASEDDEYKKKEKEHREFEKRLAQDDATRKQLEKKYEIQGEEYARKDKEFALKEEQFKAKDREYADRDREYQAKEQAYARKLAKDTELLNKRQQEFEEKERILRQKEEENQLREQLYAEKERQLEQKERRFAELDDQYKQRFESFNQQKQALEEEHQRKNQDYALRDQEYASKEDLFKTKTKEFEEKEKEYVERDRHYMERIAKDAELRKEVEDMYKKKDEEYIEKENKYVELEEEVRAKEEELNSMKEEFHMVLSIKEEELEQKHQEYHEKELEFIAREKLFEEEYNFYKAKDEEFARKEKEFSQKEHEFEELKKELIAEDQRKAMMIEELQEEFLRKEAEYTKKMKEHAQKEEGWRMKEQECVDIYLQIKEAYVEKDQEYARKDEEYKARDAHYAAEEKRLAEREANAQGSEESPEKETIDFLEKEMEVTLEEERKEHEEELSKYKETINQQTDKIKELEQQCAKLKETLDVNEREKELLHRIQMRRTAKTDAAVQVAIQERQYKLETRLENKLETKLETSPTRNLIQDLYKADDKVFDIEIEPLANLRYKQHEKLLSRHPSLKSPSSLLLRSEMEVLKELPGDEALQTEDRLSLSLLNSGKKGPGLTDSILNNQSLNENKDVKSQLMSGRIYRRGTIQRDSSTNSLVEPFAEPFDRILATDSEYLKERKTEDNYALSGTLSGRSHLWNASIDKDLKSLAPVNEKAPNSQKPTKLEESNRENLQERVSNIESLKKTTQALYENLQEKAKIRQEKLKARLGAM